MWKIREIEMDNQVVVAPMAGISNLAFRSICKQFGAGLIGAEMLSDKAIFYGNEKTLGMSEVGEDEHPMSMQLFGHDIDTMLFAAKELDEKSGCDIIDINMGCPVNKVVKNNAGSALMRDPKHAFKLVETIVKAVKKPVTVKIRAGWDMDSVNAVEFAQGLEKAGASAIAIHGRTRAQMYEGKANWDIIKAVKQNVSIPVIGNGDVKSVQDFEEMLSYTGCDAVMIGRALLGNPWLIKECVSSIKSESGANLIGMEERFTLARDHAKRLIDLKGESVAIKEMRGHAAWYVKGLMFSHTYKEKLSNMNTYKELDEILAVYQTQLDGLK